MIKYLPLGLFFAFTLTIAAQSRKINYSPCYLKDSVDRHLDFIKLNSSRIFKDSSDCRQSLIDSIGDRYLRTRQTMYLDVLASIRQNPAAKAEDLYTDIITRFIEDDFSGFVDQLAKGKGKYLSLEKELVAAMNMIVNGRPLRQKYMGELNLDIEMAKDKKDKYKQAYLEKLKQKIEEEKIR